MNREENRAFRWRLFGPDPNDFAGQQAPFMRGGSWRFPSPQHCERFRLELKRWFRERDEQRAATQKETP